jgi:hypothetical protein
VAFIVQIHSIHDELTAAGSVVILYRRNSGNRRHGLIATVPGHAQRGAVQSAGKQASPSQSQKPDLESAPLSASYDQPYHCLRSCRLGHKLFALSLSDTIRATLVPGLLPLSVSSSIPKPPLETCCTGYWPKLYHDGLQSSGYVQRPRSIAQ